MRSHYTFTERLQVLCATSFNYHSFTLRECKNYKIMANGKVCVVAVLCSLIILSSFIDSTESASCCLRYSRRHVRCKRLLGYTIQTINGSCDINAVIFHLPGTFICASPSSSFTKRAMAYVDNMRKPVRFLQGGTSNTTASE